MLTREEIQIDLLTKLNELCDKANVKYVLHDQAAFLAYNDEPIDSVASGTGPYSRTICYACLCKTK